MGLLDESILENIPPLYACEKEEVSVEVYPDHYYLVLSEPFSIAQKRRLGRLISEECNFRAYVHKVIYNNAQDTSGQLFRLCTDKDKTVNKSSVARKGI